MKSRKLGILGSILIPTLFALGATLVAFGFFVYLSVSIQLYRGMDAVLRSKTEGLIESIDLFWRLGGKDRNARAEFASFAKTWVNEKSKDSILINSVVQISAIDGGVIATSRNISFWPDKPLLAGKNETIEASFSDGTAMRLRVYTQDVPERYSPGYRIIVGEPALVVESAENNLRDALVLFVPGMLLFLAFTITVIARHELAPLDAIVQSMKRIGAENLTERIAVSGGAREIEALTNSYDTMLDRLDRAFTEQRMFIADLSHQIKTPLAVVKGQFETTLRRQRSESEYREALESGLEEIDTLANLMEKLLLLARYDSLELRQDFRDIDLSAEIARLVEDFAPLAEARGLGVVLSLSPATIRGDTTMVRQAFVNLFDNAVKYAAPGSSIAVTVAREHGSARVSVRNHGVVIASDELPRLFERFRRFDRTGTKGFGLGLSIVDSIARQHRARVEATSDKDRGTEFSLVFPVQD